MISLAVIDSVTITDEPEFSAVAMALDLMPTLDTAFAYLTRHDPAELARFNQRYPECFFADVGF